MTILWRHDLWEKIEHKAANFGNTQRTTCCLRKALLPAGADTLLSNQSLILKEIASLLINKQPSRVSL